MYQTITNFLMVTVWVMLLIVYGYPTGYFILEKNPELSAKVSELTSRDVTYQGVGSYIINMDRSKDRYNYVKGSVEAVGFAFERVSAVDESKMNAEEKDKYIGLETYSNFLAGKHHIGTIGCYLSHIKVWETFLASDYEFALIFEDDVMFDATNLRMITEELIQNNHMWDINSFDILNIGSPVVIKEFGNKQKLVIYLTRVLDSGCYIINRKAAAKLLEKALPIKMPLDNYFTRAWEFDLKFTGVENPRIAHQAFGTSTMTEFDKSSSFNHLKTFIIWAQSDLMTLIYNLKLYIYAKWG